MDGKIIGQSVTFNSRQHAALKHTITPTVRECQTRLVATVPKRAHHQPKTAANDPNRAICTSKLFTVHFPHDTLPLDVARDRWIHKRSILSGKRNHFMKGFRNSADRDVVSPTAIRDVIHETFYRRSPVLDPQVKKVKLLSRVCLDAAVLLSGGSSAHASVQTTPRTERSSTSGVSDGVVSPRTAVHHHIMRHYRKKKRAISEEVHGTNAAGLVKGCGFNLKDKGASSRLRTRPERSISRGCSNYIKEPVSEELNPEETLYSFEPAVDETPVRDLTPNRLVLPCWKMELTKRKRISVSWQC